MGEESNYEWAEFNLPAEAAIGPHSLSPLAKGALAGSRGSETVGVAVNVKKHWRVSAILRPGLLLRP